MGMAGLLERHPSDQRTSIAWRSQAHLKSRETPVSLVARARRFLPALGLLLSSACRARFQQSSTALHRFLARIGENFIDAAEAEIYLAPQIEPEAET
jgi:hypothetical protein